jgi:preprotein translocase SecF subunit
MKFGFVAVKLYAFIFSALVMLSGLFALLTGGLNLGIDFTGGTLLHFNMGRAFTLEEVRQALEPFALQGSSLQQVGEVGADGGEKQEILIRTPSLDPDRQAAVVTAFREHFVLPEEALLRVETVGPVVGGELQRQAVWALGLASLLMILYITVRFEYRFAGAAILALLHDALAIVAFFYLFKVEVNSPFVAAILTTLGYSVNATIIIFDRIRENLKSRRKETLSALVESSIRQSLVRCVNSSLTTLLVLLTLYIFGGVTLRPFMAAMLVGVVLGTYSSIFLAGPLWLTWKEAATLRRTKARPA